MRQFHYKLLVDGSVVPVTLKEWAFSLEGVERQIQHTTFPDNVRVSTAFIGIDHSLEGSPLELFETMIFDGPLDNYTWRYATFMEAVAGHDAAVALVIARINTDSREAQRAQSRAELTLNTQTAPVLA